MLPGGFVALPLHMHVCCSGRCFYTRIGSDRGNPTYARVVFYNPAGIIVSDMQEIVLEYSNIKALKA